MKYDFLIITSFNNHTGFGNFLRCANFFKFLKKNYKCQMYVDTNNKNFTLLKKYFKHFKKFKLANIKFKQNQIIFLDSPNLDKKTYNFLKKRNLVCYGNNNYFNHKKKILPFDKNQSLNSSIFYSITNSYLKKIKYEKLSKIFFYIYLSTDFKDVFLEGIIKQIRKFFSNKIYIYTNKKKSNLKPKFTNVKILKRLNMNYITDNMIYVGNIGSGGVDRAARGVISLTFSKNKNEEKIYHSLKKYHKNLFYYGKQNQFNKKKFLKEIKNIKYKRYPFTENRKNYFLNNNLKLKEKVVSLFDK